MYILRQYYVIVSGTSMQNSLASFQGSCESRFRIFMSEPTFAARKAASGLTYHSHIFSLGKAHTEKCAQGLSLCVCLAISSAQLISSFYLHSLFCKQVKLFPAVKLHLNFNCRAKYIAFKTSRVGSKKSQPSPSFESSPVFHGDLTFQGEGHLSIQRHHRASGVVVEQNWCQTSRWSSHTTFTSQIRLVKTMQQLFRVSLV